MMEVTSRPEPERVREWSFWNPDHIPRQLRGQEVVCACKQGPLKHPG